jgi:lambda family phage portal protein
MIVPEMLDAVVRTYLAYGEAFGVLDYLTIRERRPYGLLTGTKVRLVAPHRLPRITREFEGLEGGIFQDARGRALAYRFRTRESGLDMDQDIKASDVIHVMDRGLNPSSSRGISVIAPALKVLAQYDQLADATLATALMQTIFAATIKSPAPSEEAFQAIQTLRDIDPPVGYEGDWAKHVGGIAEDLIDVWGVRLDALKEKGISMSDPARINHLGPDEVFEMHTASTPGSQYLPFSQNLQREMARCLGITFESFSMDHSDANYSSVRMAVSTMWPITIRRRERIAAPFAQALYENWLEEGIAEARIPLKGGYQAFLANKQKVVWAEWRGPEMPTADPYKDALADKLKLETGATTLQRIYAAKGQDWEEELEQAGKEVARLGDLKIPAPHGRGTGGGGGPLGAAAEGRREPAREENDA